MAKYQGTEQTGERWPRGDHRAARAYSEGRQHNRDGGASNENPHAGPTAAGANKYFTAWANGFTSFTNDPTDPAHTAVL